jgi:hypothetical protein
MPNFACCFAGESQAAMSRLVEPTILSLQENICGAGAEVNFAIWHNNVATGVT